MMFSTYWQLSSRLLDEEECGYSNSSSGTFMHSHTHHHHQYSHQNYPINYSRRGGSIEVSDVEAGGIKPIERPESKPIERSESKAIKRPESILRTPQPKRSAKNIFNDTDNDIIVITKTDASKLADQSASSFYHQKYRIYDGEISSSTVSSETNDYKSLQISPLDFCQVPNKSIY